MSYIYEKLGSSRVSSMSLEPPKAPVSTETTNKLIHFWGGREGDVETCRNGLNQRHAVLQDPHGAFRHNTSMRLLGRFWVFKPWFDPETGCKAIKQPTCSVLKATKRNCRFAGASSPGNEAHPLLKHAMVRSTAEYEAKWAQQKPASPPNSEQK